MTSGTALKLPAVGVWDFETAHTTIGFVARHLMVTKVRGRFTKFDASVTIGESIEQTKVVANIDVASVTTTDEKRDGHLRSADFFDVEKFPTMAFSSTSVSAVDENHLSLKGDLTIRDVTKPVTIDVEYLGATKNPWGIDTAAFSGSTEIDREEWGLSWNQPLAGGGVLVGKKVQLEFEIQAHPHQESGA